MKLKIISSKKINNNELYSKFILEPLDFNLGISIGTFLRRLLLNNLTGTCITGVDFSETNVIENNYITGIQEDIFEICDNLKKIVLSSNKIKTTTCDLEFKGPGIVTATNLFLPSFIILINPEQYIATINTKTTLKLKVLIEQGKNFKFSIEENKNKFLNNFIKINSKFNPVLKVNFKTNLKTFYTNKNEVILKEALILEIWTNGALTPKRALLEIYKIILNIFYF